MSALNTSNITDPHAQVGHGDPSGTSVSCARCAAVGAEDPWPSENAGAGYCAACDTAAQGGGYCAACDAVAHAGSACPHCGDGDHDHDHADAHLIQKLKSRHPFWAVALSNRTRLITGAALFAAGEATKWNSSLSLGLFVASMLVTGVDVMVAAVKNIFIGRVFSEHFLMTVAAIGALFIGNPAESSAVMLLYLLGTALEQRATARTRRSINALADLRPRVAHRVAEDGAVTDHEPRALRPGDRIRVFAGERVPLDGTLRSPQAQLDYSALTGESIPKRATEGEEVLAGAINGANTVDLLVTRDEQHSAIVKILNLAETASKKKTKIETFTSRFSRVYTPIVVVLAAMLAFIPPLVIEGASLAVWGYRALSFLVISCPCSLVISVPLTFIAGMGNASKNGILIRGSTSLEALSQAKTCVFDKTGTLTTGKFAVSRTVTAPEVTEDQLTYYAALAEQYGTHPIAEAIRSLRKDLDLSGQTPTDVEERAGKGIRAAVDGVDVLIGNRGWLEENGVRWSQHRGDAPAGVTPVHVALDGAWAGTFYVEDALRPTTKEAVDRLRELGVSDIAIFSGDERDTTSAMGRRLGVDNAFGAMMPEDKLTKLEQVRDASEGRTLFVGDGINDAPALRLADVGIAMGGLGADAAIEAADVVVMTDDLSRVPDAVAVSRRTMGIVHQNVLFILLTKVALLVLGAFGVSSLWAAVFADTGVMVLAVLNALRASRGPLSFSHPKPKKEEKSRERRALAEENA